jgi:hypothetical protein
MMTKAFPKISLLVAHIVCLVGMAVGSSAKASDTEYIGDANVPRLEFALGLGSARQAGYLTTADALGSYNFAVHLYAPRGIFAFEFGSFKGTHDTGEFNMANNSDFNVETFAWMSYINVYSGESLKGYLGLGLGEISVVQNSPDYRTNYGTIVWGGILRYQLADKWSLQWKSQWFGVEQRAAGISTSFEAWNNTLGIGYQWK